MRRLYFLLLISISVNLFASDDGISPGYPVDLDGNPITTFSRNLYWPDAFPNQPANIWVYGMNNIPGSNQNGCVHLCNVLNGNPANRAICYLNVPNTPYMPDFLHYQLHTNLTPDYQIYFNVYQLEPTYPCKTLDEYIQIVQDPELLNRTRFVDFSDGKLQTLTGPPSSLQRYMSPTITQPCSPPPPRIPKVSKPGYTRKRKLSKPSLMSMIRGRNKR